VGGEQVQGRGGGGGGEIRHYFRKFYIVEIYMLDVKAIK